MANINRVVLVGNLTRDPELRHTPSGTAVCKLRVAVNTRQKDSTGQWVDKPNYFDVTVWGNQGESCAQYLAKGRPIGVDGRLDWREWEAQDGTKRQAVEIIARVHELVDKSGGLWDLHDAWGRRKLAYEIGHKSDGSYHLLIFRSSPETLDEVSRVLKITDGVMRHLATRRPKPHRRSTAAPAGAPPPAEAPVAAEGEGGEE